MLNLTINDYIVCITSLLALFCILYLIFTSKSNENKKKFINSIPHVKVDIKDKVMQHPMIARFVEDITKANGMENDSPQKLINEVIKGLVFGLVFTLFCAITDKLFIGIIILIVLAGYPVVGRILDKKNYKKRYIADFYVFLNYLTLYLSGGVLMKQAINEVASLMPDTSVIKPKLNDIVSRGAISGFDGNNFIGALEMLNDGLDYSEIEVFIALARRTEERGDPIADALLSQIEDISKKVDIEKHSYIDSQQSMFEVMQVLFGMIPAVLVYAAPLFVAAVISLTGGV